MKKIKIQNTINIGKCEEVANYPIKNILNGKESGEVLDGLIIRGFESKFSDTPNENGEIFAPDCLNKHIENYFIKNELNMPVTVMHRDDIEHLAGRVLNVSVSEDGINFVSYIPKTYKHYETLKNLISNGIIQGFSKSGWATDWDVDNKNIVTIKEMVILDVSLVTSPANSLPFETTEETEKIKNSLNFENKLKDKNKYSIEDLLT